MKPQNRVCDKELDLIFKTIDVKPQSPYIANKKMKYIFY